VTTSGVMHYSSMHNSLHCVFSAGEDVYDSLIEGFFRRLPHCLEELELISRSSHESSWRLLTNIRKLSLWQCSNIGTATSVLISLADEHILPALQEICLIEEAPDSNDNDNDLSLRKNLRLLFESRWRTPKGRKIRFSSISTVKKFLCWMPEDRVWVQDLLSRSFELEICEDGQQAEYLYTKKKQRGA
jgi:hypothetical protein